MPGLGAGQNGTGWLHEGRGRREAWVRWKGLEGLKGKRGAIRCREFVPGMAAEAVEVTNDEVHAVLGSRQLLESSRQRSGGNAKDDYQLVGGAQAARGDGAGDGEQHTDMSRG